MKQPFNKPEEQFRLMVEAVQDYAIFMLSPDGTVETWNSGAQRIKGYTSEEIIRKHFSIFYTAEDIGKNKPAQELEVAKKTGRYEEENWRVRKDGSKFWANVIINALEDETHRLIGFVKITRDLTEQKRAEELHQSEGRFRLMVESAPNAMVMVDAKGSIVLINRQTEKMFGYKRDELIGKSIELLVPERFRQKHPTYREGFFASPLARPMGAGRDLFALRKDGTELPVEIGLNPIETKQGTFVLSSIVDITERKRAEEKFRLAVEAAPNAMIMVNQDGKIVLVNTQAEQLFGYVREDMIGKSVDMLVPFQFRKKHPEHRQAFYSAPETRPMGKGRDLFGLKKDGTQFPVEIGLNPIETEEGTFVLSSIVDITERKQAEDELRRSNKELEQFAYIASHDLQEPLRTVSNFADLLTIRCRDQLNKEAAQYLSYIVDGAVRAQRLIRELLEYARIGTRGEPFQRCELNDILRKTLVNLKIAIHDSNAAITSDPLPVITADPSQLVQLLQNLIENAIKYRDKKKPVQIHISSKEADNQWIISIRDNGIGIDPAFKDKIFNIFQRLHTKGEYPGTGIGLAVCKRIVERHGGKIWVESEPREGSTFYFSIPAAHDVVGLAKGGV